MAPPVEQATTATAETTDFNRIKMLLASVPNFDGTRENLNQFITTTQTFFQTLKKEGNEDFNTYLVNLIKNKLRGEAQKVVNNLFTATSIEEINNTLSNHFGDHRNLDVLINEVMASHIRTNESNFQYGQRLQNLLSDIASKLSTVPVAEMPVATKTIKYQEYQKLSLLNYLCNLPPVVQNNIRVRNPPSLERAMALVLEEENFSTISKQMNQQKFNKYQTPQTPQPFFKRQPNNYQNQNNYQSPRQFNVFAPRPSVQPPPQPMSGVISGVAPRTTQIPRANTTQPMGSRPTQPNQYYKSNFNQNRTQNAGSQNTQQMRSVNRPNNYFTNNQSAPKNFTSQELFENSYSEPTLTDSEINIETEFFDNPTEYDPYEQYQLPEQTEETDENF